MRNVLVLAILGLLVSSVITGSPNFKIADTPHCVALKSFTLDVPKPDGIYGSFINNLDFINGLCLPTTTNINYDSGWKNDEKHETTLQLGYNVTVKSTRVRRTVDSTIDTSEVMTALDVKIAFEIDVEVWLEGGILTTIYGSISKHIEDVPAEAVPFFPIPWEGKLASSSTKKIRIIDADLFDNAVPAIVLCITTACSPNKSYQDIIDKFMRTIANIPMRMEPLAASMSSIRSSARGSFLHPDVLPKSAASSSIGGKLRGDVTIGDEMGVLTQANASCSGSSCPSSLVQSLTDIVSESLDNKCGDLTLLKIESSLKADIFLGSSSFISRGVAGYTSALFKCGNNGYAGVFFNSHQEIQDAWPVSVYLTDPMAAAGMAKSSELIPHGLVKGRIQDSGKVYSILEADLFSSSNGGILVEDIDIESHDIQNFLQDVSSRIITGDYFIDHEIAETIPFHDYDVISQDYMSVTTRPTFFGFVQWFFYHYVPGDHVETDEFDSSSFEMFATGDGNNIYISQYFRHIASLGDGGATLGDLPLEDINHAIENLGAKVKEEFPSAASYVVPSLKDMTQISSLKVYYYFRSLVDYTVKPHPSASQDINNAKLSYYSLDISFEGQSNALFTQATVKLDAFDFDNTWDILAEVNKNLQGAMGKKVGFDMHRTKLVRDSKFPSDPALLIYALNITANDMTDSQWASTLDPLSINLGMLRGYKGKTEEEDVFLAEAVISIGSILGKYSSQVDAWELASAVTEYMESLSSELMVRVVPVVGTSSLDISIRFPILRMAEIDRQSTSWKLIVDTNRVKLPVHANTELQFKISANDKTGPQGLNFTSKGNSYLTGWTCPFLYGMLEGYVYNGTVLVDFDFPEYGSMNVIMNSVNEDSTSGFLATISVPELGTSATTPPSMNIYGGQDRALPPTTLFNTFKDIVLSSLSSIPDGPMNAIYPLMSTDIGSSISWDKWVSNEVTPWLTLPTGAYGTSGTAKTVLAVSGDVCMSSVVHGDILSFNVSVNDRDMVVCSCDTSKMVISGLEDLGKAVEQAIKNCGLDMYLEAGLATVEDGDCGRIGLFPAKKGIVWKLSIAKESGYIPFRTSYSRPSIPSFSTWKDFSLMLPFVSKVFSADVSPDYTYIKSDAVKGLIPSEIANVYPSKLPAVFIKFDLHHLYELINVSIVENLSVLDGLVKLNIPEGSLKGTVETSLKARVGAVFNAPPQGEGRNISLMTSVSTPNDTVPLAPNNTFAVRITAEMRSSNGIVVPFRQIFNVTLPPGKKLLDAMLDDFLYQIDETIRPLVKLSIWNGIPLYPGDNNTQIKVSLSKYQLPDHNGTETWLMPLALQFIDSRIPYIFSSVNAPSTYRVLTSEFQLDTVFSISADIPDAKGYLGVFGVDAQKTDAIANIGISVGLKDEIANLGSLIGPINHRSTFFSQFNATVYVDSSVNVTQFDVLAGDVVVPIGTGKQPVMEFYAGGFWKLVDTDGFDKMTEGFKWSLEFNGDPNLIGLYESLLHLDSHSLCSWMTLVGNASNEIMDTSLANVHLPFSSHTLSYLWYNGVGKTLDDAVESACSRSGTAAQTIAVLCSILKDAFGYEVCANTTGVKDKILHLDLVIVPFKKSFNTKFRLDTPSIFGIKDVPIGIGTSGDFQIEGEFDIVLNLQANLGGGSDGISDLKLGPGSRFALTAEFDAHGSLDAYFGPLIITFADAKAMLGSPAAMEVVVSEKEDLEFKIVGNSLLTARVDLPEYQCMLGVAVTDLGKFLGGDVHAPVVVLNETGCGPDGFARAIEDAILESSLLEYIENPEIFATALENGIDSFIYFLFGRHGKFANLAVPLVNKVIEEVVGKQLADIIGPTASKEIVAGLTKIALEIIETRKLANMTEIDQLVLDGITGLLCTTLKPILKSCPPVPNVMDKEYDWPMYLGRTIFDDVHNISFELGEHGFAYFDLQNCVEELKVDWSFTFTISLSRSYELSLKFDILPVFRTAFDLGLTTECKLEGKIGFLGAEMFVDEQTGLKGELEINSLTKLPIVDISAYLGGEIDLGFAGILKKEIKKFKSKDPLEALPHWKASLKTGWEYSDVPSSTTPAYFKLMDGEMCVGTILVKVLGGVAKEVKKVLEPLDPIIGPDGILNKKIGATKYILGHEMTVIELLKDIVDDFCSGDCEFEDVMECIQFIIDFYKMIDDLDALGGIDPEGCNITMLIEDFELDFKNPKVVPIPLSDVPSTDLHFNKFSEPGKAIANGYWEKTTVTGKWTVHLDLIHEIPEKIIKLILGEDVSIISVSVPELTIAASAHFSVVVWVWPEIMLGVGVGASVSIDVGEICYTTRGIRQALDTKSLGKIIDGVALSTVYPDGSRRWPFKGSVTVYGEVDVGIWILEGGVRVSITLDGGAGFVSPNGDGFIYFDQLWWMIEHNGVWGAMSKELELKAEFELYLRACIHLLFIHKCWTFAHKSWDFPIFPKKIWDPKVLKPVSSASGTIDMGILSDNPYASLPAYSSLYAYQCSRNFSVDCAVNSEPGTFRLYQGNVIDFFYSGVSSRSSTPPMSRTILSPGSNFGYSGSSGSLPFMYEVMDVNVPVVFPSSSVGTLHFSQSANEKSSKFLITPKIISPSASSGVQFAGQCGGMALVDPVPGTSVSITGIPCASTVDSVRLSNVSIQGETSLYKGKTLTITGDASFVDISVDATKIGITSSTITGDADFNLNIPADTMQEVAASCQSSDCEFTINSTPAQRMMSLVGGKFNSHFTVPEFDLLEGPVLCNGGQGTNSMHVNVVTKANSPVSAVLTPLSLIQQEPSLHVMHIQKIQQRFVQLTGAENTVTNFLLVSPPNGQLIQVSAEAKKGGKILQRVTGCGVESEIRISLTGSGSHYIQLGENEKVSSFKCTVRITGETTTQVNNIVIQAAEEEKAMKWDLQAGALTVYDADGGSGWFNLFFEGIHQVEIHFGNGGSKLTVGSGTPPTEFLFHFPQTMPAGLTNIAAIWKSTNPMLLNGSVHKLNIGPDSPEITTVSPFSGINGMVALVTNGISEKSQVYLNSGTGKDAPGQGFVMSDACLDPLTKPNEHGTVPALYGKPTAWFYEHLSMAGFHTSVNCHFAYFVDSPENMIVNIETGADDDYLKAVNAKATVNVDFSSGDDYIYWTSPYANSLLDVGTGWDKIDVHAPIRDVSLKLGDDTVTDFVQIFNNGDSPSPSIIDNVVSPVGTKKGSVTIDQWTSDDEVYIKQKSSGTDKTPVYIKISTPGTLVKYDVSSSTEYIIEELASMSTVAFNAKGDDWASGESAPADWKIKIAVPDLKIPAFVKVYGEKGSDGVVSFDVIEKGSSYSMFIRQPMVDDDDATNEANSLETGIVTIGNFQLDATSIDHLVVNCEETETEIEIDSTPSFADLILTSSGSPVVFTSFEQSSALLVNSSVKVVPEVALGPSANIFVYGELSETDFELYLGEKAVDYHSGCVNNASKTVSSGASQWWKNQVAAITGVAAKTVDASCKCSLYTWKATSLTVHGVETLSVKKYTESYTRDLYFTNGNILTVDDTWRGKTPWGKAVIDGGKISVDKVFAIHVEDAKKAIVYPSAFSKAGGSELYLLFTNDSGLPTNVLQWEIKASTSSSEDVTKLDHLSWVLDSWNGTIEARSGVLPSVYVQEKDIEVDLKLVSDVWRNITITSDNLRVNTFDGHFLPNLQWETTYDRPLSIGVLGGENEVFLDGMRGVLGVPRMKVGGNGTRVNITSLSPDCTVSMPSSAVSFDGSSKSIVSRVSEGETFCLEPLHMCSDATWLDLKMWGTSQPPCDTPTCNVNVGLELEVANVPIKCEVNTKTYPSVVNSSANDFQNGTNPNGTTTETTWIISLNQKNSGGIDYSRFAYFMYFWYPVALLGVFLPFVVGRIFVDFGWSSIVIVAYLSGVNENMFTWNLTARAIVDAAERAVTRLYLPGIFCACNNEGDLIVQYSEVLLGVFTIIIVIANAALLVIRAYLGRYLNSRKFKALVFSFILLARAICFFCLFILLPVIVRLTNPSDIVGITVALVSISAIYVSCVWETNLVSLFYHIYQIIYKVVTKVRERGKNKTLEDFVQMDELVEEPKKSRMTVVANAFSILQRAQGIASITLAMYLLLMLGFMSREDVRISRRGFSIIVVSTVVLYQFFWLATTFSSSVRIIAPFPKIAMKITGSIAMTVLLSIITVLSFAYPLIFYYLLLDSTKYRDYVFVLTWITWTILLIFSYSFFWLGLVSKRVMRKYNNKVDKQLPEEEDEAQDFIADAFTGGESIPLLEATVVTQEKVHEDYIEPDEEGQEVNLMDVVEATVTKEEEEGQVVNVSNIKRYLATLLKDHPIPADSRPMTEVVLSLMKDQDSLVQLYDNKDLRQSSADLTKLYQEHVDGKQSIEEFLQEGRKFIQMLNSSENVRSTEEKSEDLEVPELLNMLKVRLSVLVNVFINAEEGHETINREEAASLVKYVLNASGTLERRVDELYGKNSSLSEKTKAILDSARQLKLLSAVSESAGVSFSSMWSCSLLMFRNVSLLEEAIRRI